MNYFTEEQADQLIEHAKFMFDTDMFEFCIYFLKMSDLSLTNLSRISSYQYNLDGDFQNFIKFNTFNQFNDYRHKFFKSNADFCNQFFVIKNALSETELIENPFLNSVNYLNEVFPSKIIDVNTYMNALTKVFNTNHILYFNFHLKHKYINFVNMLDSSNTSNFAFYSEQLNDDERTFYKNQYKYSRLFDRVSNQVQVEQRLTQNMYDYRDEEISFEHAMSQIERGEKAISNYLITSLNDYMVMMKGKNNRFDNALKDVMYKMADAMSSKKVQFAYFSGSSNQFDEVDEANTSNQYLYKIEHDSASLSNYSSESAKAAVETALNELPHRTKNTIQKYFVAKLTFKFKTPLTMQVKKTFHTKLNNYFINNGINPIHFSFIDEGKITAPAQGMYLNFICNNYKNIGVNPIKFMIPKLGMKSTSI